jgi:hypothetical protein
MYVYVCVYVCISEFDGDNQLIVCAGHVILGMETGCKYTCALCAVLQLNEYRHCELNCQFNADVINNNNNNNNLIY